jgi:hypothetical protein
MPQSLAQNFRQRGKSLEIFAIMPGTTTTGINGNSTGERFTTPEEANKLITSIILDGKNHNLPRQPRFPLAADREGDGQLQHRVGKSS